MKCFACGHTWQGEAGEPCPACGKCDCEDGEELYRAAILAEKEKRYRAAIRDYSRAADAGVSYAAFAVCRCMDRSQARGDNPDLYEFWLSYAAMRDGIAARAYGKYFRRLGDERAAMRQFCAAADMGHEGARLGVAMHYLRHGNRPAARFYLKGLRHPVAFLMRLFAGLRGPAIRPVSLEAPDDSVELYGKGEAAMSLGLPHIAFYYFSTAAENAYFPALERVADMCMRGQGTQRDGDRVRACLTRLGEAGRPDAYVRLGDHYMNGLIDTFPNPSAAYGAYLLAARGGDPEGMVNVADCLLDGNGVARDPALALQWYERAVALGHAGAEDRLASVKREAANRLREAKELLQKGDNDGALKVLTAAAQAGDTEAMCLLGDCLLAGKGGKPSPKGAADWYRRAAEKRSGRGMYRLGVLYMNNLGVPFDARMAEKLLTAARKSGFPAAEKALEDLKRRKHAWLAGKLYSAATVAYRRGDKAEAIRLRLAATKLGSGKAAYILGCMHECGDGVAEDRTKAKEFYTLALRLGFDDPTKKLFSRYLRTIK